MWAKAAGVRREVPESALRSKKARRGRNRAGVAGGSENLRVDAVGALAALGLEGLDRESGLLHRASHEPAFGAIRN
jgi:hypothetical protein